MATTFADAITPRTSDAIYATITAGIDADLVTNGLPTVTAGWLAGNILRTVCRVVAVSIAAGDAIVASFGNGATFALATGDVLTARCSGYEQTDRILAAAATGFVTVTNASGATLSIVAGVETFKNPTTGSVYTATGNATIVSGSFSLVPIIGPAPGIAADTGANTITQVVRVRTGVSCNNTAAVLGVALESDAALIARARMAPIARQPAATYSKFYTAALSVAGHGVAINRALVNRVTSGSGAGTVSILCAKASGALAGGEAATILAYVVANALGDSGSVSVASATVATLGAANLVLWAKDTDARTDAQIAQAASTALATEIAAVPIGGYVFGSARLYPTDRISTLLQNLGLVQSDGVPADVNMLATDIVVLGGTNYTVQRVRS